MKNTPHPRLLTLACGCALAGIALMVWSLFDPRPLPVVGAMSVGQAFGTLSFGLFLYVVAMDLRPGLREALAEEDKPAKTNLS
jgi:hypothetical protein